MKINNLDVKIFNFEYEQQIKFKILESDSGKPYIIDRGTATDKYSCTIITRGTRDYIESIQTELNTNTYLTLSDVDVPIFGDNIFYTNDIQAVLESIDSYNQVTLNVWELRFSMSPVSLNFLSVEGDLSFGCLNHSTSIQEQWNRSVLKTYNNDIYDINRNKKIFKCTFTITCGKDKCAYLQYYRRAQRGIPFIITESTFGLDNPFSSSAGSYPYTVIIEDMDSSWISANKRQVTITLRKV